MKTRQVTKQTGTKRILAIDWTTIAAVFVLAMLVLPMMVVGAATRSSVASYPQSISQVAAQHPNSMVVADSTSVHMAQPSVNWDSSPEPTVNWDSRPAPSVNWDSSPSTPNQNA